MSDPTNIDKLRAELRAAVGNHQLGSFRVDVADARALLDHIDSLEARVEAAEKERDETNRLNGELGHLGARLAIAEAELARLRAPVPLGNHIRFSPAEDGVGNAVVCPDEPEDGCYWTLIGSGPNADQNRIAQAICDTLNARLRAPAEGEVVEMVKRLHGPLHWWKPNEAADLIQRLAGQVAEAQRRYDGVYAQWGLAAKLCDEHRDRAAIAAMQPRWRDVRTDPPPRDGTRVLVWSDEPEVAWWDRSLHAEGWTTDCEGFVRETYFTHWQHITPPLPTAPEDTP